jgi:sterol desaturase/sphingolipid hydroxylase (fatty acid hydroxylase superfamily)
LPHDDSRDNYLDSCRYRQQDIASMDVSRHPGRVAHASEVAMTALVRILVGAVAFVAFTVAEGRRPLRTPTQPRRRRLAINLVVGAVALGAVLIGYRVVVLGSVEWAERNQVGVLRWLGAPPAIAAGAAVVLLDYTLWHWHWLNHRLPPLWRFHAAHHADLDLDTSTALRFHPGELVLSLPYRAAQVVVLGVGAAPLLVWETLVLVSTQFHHSNLRLPERIERILATAIITPRIHGIHHSIRAPELHSNFGTIFSWWDRVHRTRVVGVPQGSIRIGLPGLLGGRALGLGASLGLPFRARPPSRGQPRDMERGAP